MVTLGEPTKRCEIKGKSTTLTTTLHVQSLHVSLANTIVKPFVPCFTRAKGTSALIHPVTYKVVFENNKFYKICKI